MTAPIQKAIRCALYARVSPTPEGKAGENFSIKSQLHEMRAKALKEFGCANPDEYTDRNQSGGTLDRPELDRLRDMVALKMYDVIIAYDPGRWTREPADKIILKREIEKGKARLVYVTVQYEDTAEGGLSEDVQDAVSKYEKRKFKERARRCRRQKSRDGFPHACKAPDGYIYRGHQFGIRGEYSIDPKRAKVVKLIFERTAAGISAAKVAIWLNSQGIRTQKGFQFLRESVTQILKKKHYCGEMFQNGERIEIPQIISPELWEQAFAARQRMRLAKKGRPPLHYLLSGMLWCSRCEKRCVTFPKENGKGAYRCGNVNPHNRNERYCLAPEIRSHNLEPVIWDAVWDTVCDDDLLWQMIEAYYDRVAPKSGKAKNPAIAQIDRARRAVTHAERIFRDPESPLAYETRKSDLEKARRELAEAEMRAPAQVFQMPARKDIAAAAAEFRKMRKELVEFEDRREALQLLVSKIMYADYEAEIHCRITPRKWNRRECDNSIFSGSIPFVINVRTPEIYPPDARTEAAYKGWQTRLAKKQRVA